MSDNTGKQKKGKLVDIHSHILPAVDDGSEDMGMSRQLLEIAKKEGITDVFLTSHSYKVLETDITEVFQKTKMFMEENGMDIHLFLGCEVAVSGDGRCDKWGQKIDSVDDIIVLLNDKRIPTMNQTRYVLTEFIYGIESEEAAFILQKLQNAGYKPIIAHAERFPALFKNHAIEKFYDAGNLIQINAYSLYEEQGEAKQFARMLLEKKMVHFIGTDAHKIGIREPKVVNGVKYIFETCDETYAREICYRNAEKYLGMDK